MIQFSKWKMNFDDCMTLFYDEHKMRIVVLDVEESEIHCILEIGIRGNSFIKPNWNVEFQMDGSKVDIRLETRREDGTLADGTQ